MNKVPKIPGGAIIVARKIQKSPIWLKPPLYLKTWLWILMKASHAHHQKNKTTFKKGEFLTTYDEIIKGASYYQNRKHVVPTIKQIRVILSWLQAQEMVTVQPLTRSELPTGADPRAETRAYVGIKIVVVNYDTYQDLTSYKGRDKGIPNSPQGQYNNNGYKNDSRLSGKKARRAKPNPDVKRFIEWWVKTFEEKFKAKYLVNGKKDGSIVKRLLSTDSYNELIKLSQKFFESQDEFIKQAGYTIGVFSTQANKLKSQGPQRRDRYAT